MKKLIFNSIKLTFTLQSYLAELMSLIFTRAPELQNSSKPYTTVGTRCFFLYTIHFVVKHADDGVQTKKFDLGFIWPRHMISAVIVTNKYNLKMIYTPSLCSGTVRQGNGFRCGIF